MQYHTLSKKSHGDNAEVVFKRNTIPRQYMDLVQHKFANQRQEVMDTITKLRRQIRATSIDTEAGQLEVFQTNKAMKTEIEYLKTINQRQEKSNFLTRDYKVAKSIETKEMLEAAMTLEIEAIHLMMNQQQQQQTQHPVHQPSDTTSTMKNKKNNNKSPNGGMVRQVQSQLSLTRLQKYNLKKQLKKQQREETRQEPQQDSDTTTTDSTRSNNSSSSSYANNTPDVHVVAPSPPPSPSPHARGTMKRSVSMSPGMMKRSVSFSTFTDVKMVPTVLDLLGGNCDSTTAAAKDNIWYDKRDFCGFAQKEMSRRSDLGITSTSALHSHVGSSDDGDSEIGGCDE